MPDILGQKEWELILWRINDGKCTYFLGSRNCSKKIHVNSQIVNKRTKKYDYQIEDNFDELHIQYTGKVAVNFLLN